MPGVAPYTTGMPTLVSMLLSLMDEPVVIMDSAGVIAGWSEGAERLLGYGPSDVLGKPCTELCAPSWRPTLERQHELLANGLGPAVFEITLVGKGGEERLVQTQMTMLPGSTGTQPLMVCTLSSRGEAGSSRDLSTRQLRELWALLESVPVAFSHLDREQRFLYLNKAALRNIPDGVPGVIGRHVREVFGDRLYEQVKPEIDVVLTGKECSSEITLPMQDGTLHHFLRHLYPHLSVDGTVKGYFSVLVDVTEAKVTQESLLRREHMLRSTLVREINHRVKNSLQGLIGMMRLHDPLRTTQAALIDQCVSQLMAVAVTFGLASKHGEARILLCDMVRDIAHSVSQVSGRNILVELRPSAAEHPIPLSEVHSVNISLVINEIIFNAVKHSHDATGQSGVRVAVERSGPSATVRVTNVTGTLPEGFSYASGTGLGTGLSLVRALLPPKGCDLSITQEPEGTVATLRLEPPVMEHS